MITTYKTASNGRQLALAGFALLVICAVLIAAYFVFLRKPYETLFADLKPNDAATVVAELDRKKVPYRLTNSGTTIKVPSNLVDRTRIDIMSEDLPLKGTVGFELFNKSDMGLTEFAQKINYQRALQGELARTIMTMEAVETARIHLSLPESTIFRDDRQAPKASVTILTKGGAMLPVSTVLGIQRLVAASVPELAVNDVVVLDSHGGVVSASMAPSPYGVGAAQTPASVQAKQAIEQYYAASVRQAVAAAFPGRSAQVRVWAEYDPLDPSASAGWSPASRSFPLDVTVFADIAQSPESEAELRAVIVAAIGSKVGDKLGLSPLTAWQDSMGPQEPVAAMPLSPVAVPAIVPQKAAPIRPAGSGNSFWIALLASLAIVGVVVAAIANQRRKVVPRRLSEQEQDAYAQRLRQLLDEGEVDVLSPS